MKHYLIVGLLLVAGCKSEATKNQEAADRAQVIAAINQDIEDRNHRVSIEKYGTILLGMPQAEAEKIMYKPGVQASASQVGGSRTELYNWDFGTNGTVTLIFQDGQLISKSQHGLY